MTGGRKMDKINVTSERVLATPLVKRLAAENNIELSALIPSSPDGKLSRVDIERYMAEHVETAPVAQAVAMMPVTAMRATPLAKKLAKNLGVDMLLVSVANGLRIYSGDIMLAAAKGKSSVADSLFPRESRRERIRGARKVIGERMRHSYFLYPTVTLTTEVDMKALTAFRSAYNVAHAPQGIKLSVTDIIIAATAKALREFELINASIDGDEIVYHEDVNVAEAVALPMGGLLVPVIRHADTLSLEALCKETKRLVTAARAGELNPDDMVGGTFTVTNMGVGNIDAFNPIINYPESAILGVGRTVEKVVVIDGMIAIRPRAVFSLTHDHRVIDGLPASEFLKALVHYVENPNLLS